MPKNIEDIIVSEKKRSIRDIPIPEGRRKKEHHASVVMLSADPSASGTDRTSSTGRWRNRKGVWMATGAALLVLIFATLSMFNGATLSYVPKSAALSFDNDIYTAKKDGEGELLYSIVKLSGDMGLDVPAAGEEEVNRKASGVIVVYNSASTEAQRLVENTRFQTPEGLVYRIPNAIVVPGMRTVSGAKRPGAVETVVYADEAGEKYNIGLADFTLPGLQGSARFTTIYARSKTEMSGGFVGMEKMVKSQDKAEAKTQLKTALKDELISEAQAQVPEDFILFPSLSSVTFEDLPQTDSDGKDSAKINMRGNLYGLMFKRSDLSTHLALKKITLSAGESVDVVALDSLSLSFADNAPLDMLSLSEVKFVVKGETVAVWRIDEVALKTDLIGRHKRDIPTILKNYPNVLSATATIRPFWKNSFPDDGARISIRKLPVQ